MNMKNILVSLLMVSILIASTGCTRRLVDFTIISTKNVDLSRAGSFKRGPSRVEGSDKIHIIIFIPTGTPNMKEAVDRAIEKVPGAVALVDGVVSSTWWWIPYIYGQSMFLVEGTPLIDPSLAAMPLESNFLISRLDSSGNVKEFRPVSRDEYESLKSKMVRGNQLGQTLD